MSFRLIEHTADARAECAGRTFAELLEAAAGALYAIALLDVRKESTDKRLVRATGIAREDTLIRWLQELNFLLDTEHFVATAFHFSKVSDQEAEVMASGYLCSAEERSVEVKAATYHLLAISETEEGLVARVTFDL